MKKIMASSEVHPNLCGYDFKGGCTSGTNCWALQGLSWTSLKNLWHKRQTEQYLRWGEPRKGASEAQDKGWWGRIGGIRGSQGFMLWRGPVGGSVSCDIGFSNEQFICNISSRAEAEGRLWPFNAWIQVKETVHGKECRSLDVLYDKQSWYENITHFKDLLKGKFHYFVDLLWRFSPVVLNWLPH